MSLLLLQNPNVGLLDHLLFNNIRKEVPNSIENIPPSDFEYENEESESQEWEEDEEDQKPIKEFTYQLIVLVSQNQNGMRKIERAGSIGECKRRYTAALKENSKLKMKFFDCSKLENTAQLSHKWEEYLAENFPNQFNF